MEWALKWAFTRVRTNMRCARASSLEGGGAASASEAANKGARAISAVTRRKLFTSNTTGVAAMRWRTGRALQGWLLLWALRWGCIQFHYRYPRGIIIKLSVRHARWLYRILSSCSRWNVFEHIAVP
jgi:hypothetical protein